MVDLGKDLSESNERVELSEFARSFKWKKNSVDYTTLKLLPKEWGRYCFHRSVSVHTRVPTLDWGDTYLGQGVPTLDWGGGHPPWTWVGGTYLGWGVPTLDGVGYNPPPPSKLGNPLPRRQNSIASTCYSVGGMPLAFTQEDFLVALLFNIFNLLLY